MGLGDLLAAKLKVLSDAAGDPARLALATVDLAHSSLDEAHRNELKAALTACAVPHWVDEALLGAMIGASHETSAEQLARLRALRVVEPFPARGYGAVNVHQASRIALRATLRREEPERFSGLSARARDLLLPSKEPVSRIEALYHLFAVDQEDAAAEWERIDREIVHPAERQTMAAAFEELLAEGWLSPTATTVALLTRGYARGYSGGFATLEAPAREVLALAEHTGRDVLLALAQCLLGEALAAKGNTKEAAGLFRSQLEILERRLVREPGNTALRRDVAVSYSKIADVQEADGQNEEALESMRRGCSILATLLEEHPGDVDLERELATVRARVGDVLRTLSNDTEALESFRIALDAYTRLIQLDPTNSDWQSDLADARISVARVHFDRQELNEAEAMFAESLQIYDRLVEQNPGDVGVHRAFANVHRWMGRTLRDQGRQAEVEPHLRTTVATLTRLSTAEPDDATLLRDLAMAQLDLSTAMARLGRDGEAIKGFREAKERIQRAMAMTPAKTEWQNDLDVIQSWIDNPTVRPGS